MAMASQQTIYWGGLNKVVLCWVGTPIGAMIISYILYKLFQFILEKLRLNILSLDTPIKWGLIVSGVYGAYTLGANNVANVTGVFTRSGLITVSQATLIGGITIALGMPFSERVMLTVGKNLVALDGFSAFIVTLSQALTMHIYTIIGVPTSNSQAIVGAVLGIGLVLGMRTINNRTLLNILFGWLGTPVIGAVVAFVMMKIFIIFL
jgi:PiT family inorganic phosphate transporter